MILRMSSGDEKKWWRGALDKVENQIESRQVAKEESEERYGKQTASHPFGAKWVYIYAKGFVQVKDLVAPKSSAPVERLMAIDSQADVTKKTGLGRGAGAVVTLGVNLSSSNMRGDVYLSIATESTTHSLRASPSTASVKAAKALEMAGRAALMSAGASAASATAAPAAAQAPDALDQLKKLADLHSAGVLTDEEFATKKADLLDRM